MFSHEKKPYDAPDIEKIPLSDQDLDKVSGGTQPDGETGGDSPLDHDNITNGNTDVSRLLCSTGGTRSPLNVRAPRSFSGRTSGC